MRLWFRWICAEAHAVNFSDDNLLRSVKSEFEPGQRVKEGQILRRRRLSISIQFLEVIYVNLWWSCAVWMIIFLRSVKSAIEPGQRGQRGQIGHFYCCSCRCLTYYHNPQNLKLQEIINVIWTGYFDLIWSHMEQKAYLLPNMLNY